MSYTTSARDIPDDGLRIAEVARDTGLSKELIHHYLRQGLVPACEERARYSESQVRLLRQIRMLREDHNLPLDVIRQLFEACAFDPTRIESLTQTESLCRRVTRFASSGTLLDSETLTEPQLAAASGVTPERLQVYLDARVVSPIEANGEPRYSSYDASVISLCEHGVAEGIPFESFRTIASYVRIAFDLEHAAFYGVQLPARDQEVLTSVFVRREIASGFVQNVLWAMTHRQMRAVLAQSLPGRSRGLDDVIYRPSEAFLRRHGIRDRIERARERLRDAPDEPELWLYNGRLLIHAGSYEDAVFFLEESTERWPDDRELRGALGRALALAGDLDRAVATLEPLVRGADADPRAAVYSALARFGRACGEDRPEALMKSGAQVLELARAAVAGVRRGEVAALAGWLLASLPSVYACADEGLALLREAYGRAELMPATEQLPGLAERRRINVAHLLLDRITALGAGAPPEPSELRAAIYAIDPASRFAEMAFLSEGSEVP